MAQMNCKEETGRRSRKKWAGIGKQQEKKEEL
jgi:hypothetical protein